MGLFSSKQTTKTDSTTTPITPGYLDQPLNDAWGRIHQIGGMDPSQFVAPLSGLQQQAGARAGALNDNGLFGRAADMTQSLLSGPGPGGASSGQWGAVDKYMNPYQSQVVDSALARLNQEQAMGMRGNELRFGGHMNDSNFALSQGLLGGQYDLNKQQTIGSLLKGGWDTAAQLADSQAARDNAVNMQNAALGAQLYGQQLAGAGQLANIATAQGANERANIGTIGDVGGTFQEADQAQRGAPLNLIGWQTGQYGALSPLAQLQTGQHEVGTQVTKGGGGLLGGLLSSVGGLAMGAGALGWKPFG